MVVIHNRGQQKGDKEVIKGNKAHTTAGRAVLGPVTWQLPLITSRPDPSDHSHVYTKEKLDKAAKWGFNRDLRSRVAS